MRANVNSPMQFKTRPTVDCTVTVTFPALARA